MTLDPLRGDVALDIRTGGPRYRRDIGRGSVSVWPSLQRRRHRPVGRMSYSLDALLTAGKRPGKDVAVTLDRVPAGLDAAHVGFVFTDVMGSDHCQVLLCATGRRPRRSDGGRIHDRARLPKPQSLLQVLCLPTAPVLLIGKTETSAGLDFTGSFQTRTACLVNIWLSEF